MTGRRKLTGWPGGEGGSTFGKLFRFKDLEHSLRVAALLLHRARPQTRRIKATANTMSTQASSDAAYPQLSSPPPPQAISYGSVEDEHDNHNQQARYAIPVNQHQQQQARPIFRAQEYVGLGQTTWRAGLFDCMTYDIYICLLATFLSPYRWAVTMTHAGLLRFWVALFMYGIPWLAVQILSSSQDWFHTPKHHEAVLHVTKLAAMLCNVMVTLIGGYYRGKLREKYNIAGDKVTDVCTYLCCSCCAIAQEAMHVDTTEGRYTNCCEAPVYEIRLP